MRVSDQNCFSPGSEAFREASRTETTGANGILNSTQHSLSSFQALMFSPGIDFESQWNVQPNFGPFGPPETETASALVGNHWEENIFETFDLLLGGGPTELAENSSGAAVAPHQPVDISRSDIEISNYLIEHRNCTNVDTVLTSRESKSFEGNDKNIDCTKVCDSAPLSSHSEKILQSLSSSSSFPLENNRGNEGEFSTSSSRLPSPPSSASSSLRVSGKFPVASDFESPSTATASVVKSFGSSSICPADCDCPVCQVSRLSDEIFDTAGWHVPEDDLDSRIDGRQSAALDFDVNITNSRGAVPANHLLSPENDRPAVFRRPANLANRLAALVVEKTKKENRMPLTVGSAIGRKSDGESLERGEKRKNLSSSASASSPSNYSAFSQQLNFPENQECADVAKRVRPFPEDLNDFASFYFGVLQNDKTLSAHVASSLHFSSLPFSPSSSRFHSPPLFLPFTPPIYRPVSEISDISYCTDFSDLGSVQTDFQTNVRTDNGSGRRFGTEPGGSRQHVVGNSFWQECHSVRAAANSIPASAALHPSSFPSTDFSLPSLSFYSPTPPLSSSLVPSVPPQSVQKLDPAFPFLETPSWGHREKEFLNVSDVGSVRNVRNTVIQLDEVELCIRNRLVSLAEAFAAQDTPSLDLYFSLLSADADPIGTPLQRIAFHFTNALRRREEGNAVRLYTEAPEIPMQTGEALCGFAFQLPLLEFLMRGLSGTIFDGVVEHFEAKIRPQIRAFNHPTKIFNSRPDCPSARPFRKLVQRNAVTFIPEIESEERNNFLNAFGGSDGRCLGDNATFPNWKYGFPTDPAGLLSGMGNVSKYGNHDNNTSASAFGTELKSSNVHPMGFPSVELHSMGLHSNSSTELNSMGPDFRSRIGGPNLSAAKLSDVFRIHIIDCSVWSRNWSFFFEHISSYFRACAGLDNNSESPFEFSSISPAAIFPHVRITAVDLPPGTAYSTGPRSPTLAFFEEELTGLANELQIPFTFTSVCSRLEDLNPGSFDIREGEFLAVNLGLMLSTIPDEGVLKSNPRNRVLRTFLSLRPSVLSLADMCRSLSSPSFVRRYVTALDTFIALFKAHDLIAPRTSLARTLFEEKVHGRSIINLVACDGSHMFLRFEGFGSLRRRLQSVGFQVRPITARHVSELESILTRYPNDYEIETNENNFSVEMQQGGSKLFYASAWKPRFD